MTSISVKDLHKNFKDNKVLKGLSFECNNEILFIAGRNGTGKTTFIRIALGLEFANKGSVTLTENGQPISKEDIGVVFDTPCLYPNKTCKENISILCSGYTADKKHLHSVLEKLDINKQMLSKKAGRCSFGQQHRLSMAIALIRKPKILFLDEPAIGLDPISWELIKQCILQNNKEQKGCTVLTGQDYFELGNIADKLLVLKNGVGEYFGTVDGFINNSEEDSLQHALYPELKGAKNE